MTSVSEIKGTITLADGSTSEFTIQADYGWHQWAASPSRLGQTVEVMEALIAGLQEGEIDLSDEDEEDDDDVEEDEIEEVDDGERG